MKRLPCQNIKVLRLRSFPLPSLPSAATTLFLGRLGHLKHDHINPRNHDRQARRNRSQSQGDHAPRIRRCLPSIPSLFLIYPSVIPAQATYIPTSLVIHCFLSLEEAISSLPILLDGDAPSPIPTTNIGSKNYSRGVAAVIIGGGYDDDAVAQIRKACEGKSRVPWMRPDMSTPTPPFGPQFAAALGGRVKICLKRLGEEGQMGADGMFLY